MKYLLGSFSLYIFVCLFVFFANAQSNIYLDYNQENIDNIQKDNYSNFDALLRMIVSLLIVLSLIVGGVFLLKKLRIYKLLAPDAKSPVSVISNIPLGSKRSLCLVKVANEVLIIGMTSTNISLLSKISADDYYSACKSDIDDELSSIYRKRDFPSILKSVMERFKVKVD